MKCFATYIILFCLLQEGVYEGAVHLEELNILLGKRYDIVYSTNKWIK